MTMIRVVAAVVDETRLILYKEDGNTIDIPQGDDRLRPIIDQVTPIIARGGVAEVDLGDASPNHYKEFEEQTGGLVKFFRVAKKFVSHIFGTDVVEPRTVGRIPTIRADIVVEDNLKSTADEEVATAAREEVFTNAVDQIMANAEPVTSETFEDSETTNDQTIIAVVGDKIIPGTENLKGQFAHANKLGSSVGVQNFLKRIGEVISKRGHSVDDLLKFMEKGDLPIADDGSIIAYKRLYRKGDCFVDPYTQKVLQRVGTYVFMNEKMVDPSRRNECSNGLHIGRRQYMGSFSGDVIVMCKIRPEDVIAVPQHDPNKMRVAGYHILFEAPSEAFTLICSNKPMTEDTTAGKMLTQALRGQHVKILQTVEITESRGGSLIIKDLVAPALADKVVAKNNQKAEDHEVSETVKELSLDRPLDAPAVDPKGIANAVAETKAKSDDDAPKLGKKFFETAEIRNGDEIIRPEVVSEQRQLFNDKRFADLIAFKKSKKKSWEKLGFNASEIAVIEGLGAPKVAEAKRTNTEKPKATPVKAPAKVKAEAKRTPAPKAEVPKQAAKPSKPAPAKKKVPAEKLAVLPFLAPDASRKDKVKHYLELINGNFLPEVQRDAYQNLIALKKKAKVGWMELGVSNFEAIQAKFEK